jgi:hypothetical protein
VQFVGAYCHHHQVQIDPSVNLQRRCGKPLYQHYPNQVKAISLFSAIMEAECPPQYLFILVKASSFDQWKLITLYNLKLTKSNHFLIIEPEAAFMKASSPKIVTLNDLIC